MHSNSDSYEELSLCTEKIAYDIGARFIVKATRNLIVLFVDCTRGWWQSLNSSIVFVELTKSKRSLAVINSSSL